jgi:hypothetical protein
MVEHKSGLGEKAMQRAQQFNQRGITLFGAIFFMLILGGLALLGMRVVPAVTEFREVQNAMIKARDASTTVAEVRRAFDQTAAAGYIETVNSQNLDVTKEEDKIVVSIAYEKKIPIMGPVSLVIDFAGTTKGK